MWKDIEMCGSQQLRVSSVFQVMTMIQVVMSGIHFGSYLCVFILYIILF